MSKKFGSVISASDAVTIIGAPEAEEGSLESAGVIAVATKNAAEATAPEIETTITVTVGGEETTTLEWDTEFVITVETNAPVSLEGLSIPWSIDDATYLTGASLSGSFTIDENDQDTLTLTLVENPGIDLEEGTITFTLNPGSSSATEIVLTRPASSAALYDFIGARFGNGTTGNTGPSLTQAKNAVTALLGGSVDFKNDTDFFNTSSGVVLWTVPKSGVYRIKCAGAKGGDEGNANRGGNGAIMQGDFELIDGEIIRLLVGQQANMSRNGAGGGTFVYRNATDTYPLIAAGGGGGWGGSGGNASNATTGTSGNTTYGASYASGTNGQGGSTATGSGWGGAGAGWLANGQSGGSYGGIAYAPRNGGAGGNIFTCNGGFGGFGGGGGGGCNGGGGGGGYSGGGCSGGGGGSYNAGDNQVNTVGNTGHGYVEITALD